MARSERSGSRRPDGRQARRDNSPHGIGPIGDPAWPTEGERRGSVETEPSGGQETEDVGMPNPHRANPATVDYAATVSKDVEDAGRQHKAARRPPARDVGRVSDQPRQASGAPRKPEGTGGADKDEDVTQGPSREQEMRRPDAQIARDDDVVDLGPSAAGNPPDDISLTRSQSRHNDEAGVDERRSAGQLSRHYGPGGVTEDDLEQEAERRPGAHRGRGPDTGTGR